MLAQSHANPATTIARFEAAGITLIADGDRLRWRGETAPSPELLEELHQHKKADLLLLLDVRAAVRRHFGVGELQATEPSAARPSPHNPKQSNSCARPHGPTLATCRARATTVAGVAQDGGGPRAANRAGGAAMPAIRPPALRAVGADMTIRQSVSVGWQEVCRNSALSAIRRADANLRQQTIHGRRMKMAGSRNIRDMAAERAAAREQVEAVPELPKAMAGDPRDGMQQGREVAGRYGGNLALQAAAIAFGSGTRSLHTRVQCMQLLWNMMQENPEAIPAPPNGGVRVVSG